MAFVSSGLRLIQHGGLTDSRHQLWHYYSSDSSTQVIATGYFAAVGKGSKLTNMGLSTGDVVICVESTGGTNSCRTTMHTVKASTINQASSVASSAANYGFDCTLSAAAT